MNFALPKQYNSGDPINTLKGTLKCVKLKDSDKSFLNLQKML